MHRRARNTGTAVALSILLLGVAGAVAWVGIAPTVFGEAEPALSGPLAGGEVVEASPAEVLEGVRVVGSFQIVSQPRDPFRPLITETGGTGGIVDGGTGNGDGFQPSGIRVKLVEIRDVDGVLRATVEVDGVSYDVGVGDTFAGNFFVVSLDTDSGVFLFGDNAFELSVGQEILK